MKRLLQLLMIALVAALLISCGTTPPPAEETPVETGETPDPGANLDGETVVWNEEKGQYEIETDAQLRFAVDNDAFGAAVVALWDKTHPEHAGKVTFENMGSQDTADKIGESQGELPDVILVIDGEVPRNEAHMLAFDSHLADIVRANGSEQGIDAGNPTNTLIFAPAALDGMTFVTNITMLEALGYDVTDANGDGLVDAFDTWEKIFDLAKEWAEDRPVYKVRQTEVVTNDEGEEVTQFTDEYVEQQVNVVFPMTLDNQWSDYHHLSSAGWRLYASGDAAEPGYDDPKFKEGFEFMLAAKEAKISVEQSGEVTPAAAMTWRWDNVINGVNLSPFGLVGTWQDVAGDAEATGNTYSISNLPTWKGLNQATFAKTKGYIINSYTDYRSAAHELLRLVYSQEGFQAMVDNSSYAPALVTGADVAPNLADDSVQKQFMDGMQFTATEPGYTLPSGKKGMDAVYYAHISDYEKAIWDGELSVDDAIAQLIEVTNAAIAAEQ